MYNNLFVHSTHVCVHLATFKMEKKALSSSSYKKKNFLKWNYFNVIHLVSVQKIFDWFSDQEIKFFVVKIFLLISKMFTLFPKWFLRATEWSGGKKVFFLTFSSSNEINVEYMMLVLVFSNFTDSAEFNWFYMYMFMFWQKC